MQHSELQTQWGLGVKIRNTVSFCQLWWIMFLPGLMGDGHAQKVTSACMLSEWYIIRNDMTFLAQASILTAYRFLVQYKWLIIMYRAIHLWQDYSWEPQFTQSTTITVTLSRQPNWHFSRFFMKTTSTLESAGSKHTKHGDFQCKDQLFFRSWKGNAWWFCCFHIGRECYQAWIPLWLGFFFAFGSGSSAWSTFHFIAFF